jgi:hypothetical protein
MLNAIILKHYYFFSPFSGIGFVDRQFNLLLHPQIKIEGEKRGTLKFETLMGFSKKSTKKVVVIGDQKTEFLPNREAVKVIILLIRVISIMIFLLYFELGLQH